MPPVRPHTPAHILLCLCLAAPLAMAGKPARTHFGQGHPFTLQELPAGKLKSKLQTLDAETKARALGKLHALQFDAFDA
ncbi:MAG TPA: hypothetical protein VFY13_01895, partial [Luteolibacter sp.]|nr:hypothetical protein [Luteolibacter sp.]